MTKPVRTEREAKPAFLADLFDTLTERSRSLLRRREPGEPAPEAPDMVELGEALLSRRGEASGVALARQVLDLYGRSPTQARLGFFRLLARDFGPDRDRLRAA